MEGNSGCGESWVLMNSITMLHRTEWKGPINSLVLYKKTPNPINNQTINSPSREGEHQSTEMRMEPALR